MIQNLLKSSVMLLLSWILYITLVRNRSKNHSTFTVRPQKLHPPDPQQPLPPSSSVLYIYEQAAVCSDSAICSSIGRHILQTGGSAVDGAVATLLCNGLVTMQSMGPGGGFLMNVYVQKERRAYTILARETAPLSFNESLFGSGENPRLRNARSIAVPTEIKGYALAHEKFGRLPWSELIKPTVELCHAGFPLSKHQRDSLETNRDMVKRDEHLKQMFVNRKTGHFYPIGTHIRPARELCATYKLLAEEGPDGFYDGRLSKLLAMDFKQLGSSISEGDLEEVKSEVRPSIVLPLGDFKLHLVPPPGSGVIVGFVMNVLTRFRKDFGAEKRDLNALDVHRIVEALKLGFVKRWELDTASDEEFLQNLTADAHTAHAASIIKDSMTSSDPQHYGAHPELTARSDHGTAHMSLMAPNGDAVSATSSINFYFGSGLTGPRTAVLFNNALSDFTFDGHPNYFGLPNIAHRNRVKTQRSPMSSMSPLIVTDHQDRIRLVVGAAGGPKIISALVPLLVRVLWLKWDIKQAVDAARFHHQLLPDVLEYEYGLLEDLLVALKERGHKIQRYRERGSAICGIEGSYNGLYANADYRKEGAVAGF